MVIVFVYRQGGGGSQNQRFGVVDCSTSVLLLSPCLVQFIFLSLSQVIHERFRRAIEAASNTFVHVVSNTGSMQLKKYNILTIVCGHISGGLVATTVAAHHVYQGSQDSQKKAACLAAMS